MKTNLVIVEGLPGSGKSTTADMIAEELCKKGKNVVCVDEGVSETEAMDLQMKYFWSAISGCM